MNLHNYLLKGGFTEDSVILTLIEIKATSSIGRHSRVDIQNVKTIGEYFDFRRD